MKLPSNCRQKFALFTSPSYWFRLSTWVAIVQWRAKESSYHLFELFLCWFVYFVSLILWRTRCTRHTVDQSDGIYNTYSTVARDLRQRKPPLSSGYALGLGLVYCHHKSLALCYNYNLEYTCYNCYNLIGHSEVSISHGDLQRLIETYKFS